jgi:3-isopropylmalate dehydrogenase
MSTRSVGLRLARVPWLFDVLVTENMFGDTLSHVAAELIGGIGMTPSADIGERYAVFRPCHGAAPDIAGRGLANPIAMFLAAAMMLNWLGERHGILGCWRAAAALKAAVLLVFVAGDIVSIEQGGTTGTAAIENRVRQHLTRTLVNVRY